MNSSETSDGDFPSVNPPLAPGTVPRTVWAMPSLSLLVPDSKTPASMEVMADLEAKAPPFSVITGFGAKASNHNVTAIQITYASINTDGSLSDNKTVDFGPDAGKSMEASVQLPSGFVAVGFGIKVHDGEDIHNTVLYARKWSNGSLVGDVAAYATSGKTVDDVDLSTPELPPEGVSPDLAQDVVLTCIGAGIEDKAVNRIMAKYARLLRRHYNEDNPASAYAAYLAKASITTYLPMINTLAQSVEMWIRPVSSGALLAQSKEAFQYGIILVYALEEDGCFSVRAAEVWAQKMPFYKTEPTRVFDGNWHHVAFVLQNDKVSFYFDGQPIGQNCPKLGVPITATAAVPTKLTIGANPASESGNYYSGDIDEIRLWKTVRSAAVIKQYLYSRIKSDGNLLMLCNFDHRVIRDESSLKLGLQANGIIPISQTAAPIVVPPPQITVAASQQGCPTQGRLASGYKVRYCLSFYADDINTLQGAWESASSAWTDWFTHNNYVPLLNISLDADQLAMGRKLYRQFKHQAPEFIGLIQNNTQTTYTDTHT